jgi:TPR repeat protein
MKTRRFLVVVLLLFASAAPVWRDDLAASVDALKSRAAQGEAEAQNNLGLRYYKGQGVPQDYAEALK